MGDSNSENILYLDIETVPLVYSYHQLEEPAKNLWTKKWSYNHDLSPEQQYAKAGIYAEFAKVICIGLGHYRGGKFRAFTISSDSESELLSNFSSLLEKDFNTDRHF